MEDQYFSIIPEIGRPFLLKLFGFKEAYERMEAGKSVGTPLQPFTTYLWMPIPGHICWSGEDGKLSNFEIDIRWACADYYEIPEDWKPNQRQNSAQIIGQAMAKSAIEHWEGLWK